MAWLASDVGNVNIMNSKSGYFKVGSVEHIHAIATSIGPSFMKLSLCRNKLSIVGFFLLTTIYKGSIKYHIRIIRRLYCDGLVNCSFNFVQHIFYIIRS